MNELEKIILSRFAQKYFWIGVYRRSGSKAVRVGFQGPMPPCHEFAFGTGNVGWVAQQGIRKVVSDVRSDSQYSMCFIETASELVEPIFFEDKLVGVIDVESDQKDFFTEERVEEIRFLAKVVAPLLYGADGPDGAEVVERNLRLLRWVENAKLLAPEKCQWVGIYFKESFVRKNSSTDLVLGPFIGAPTEHVRIPLDKGICGRAIREQRAINVLDVRKEPEHIACSLSTRSELVIPLRDSRGNIVAELDLDSDELAAFAGDLADSFMMHCESFAALLD